MLYKDRWGRVHVIQAVNNYLPEQRKIRKIWNGNRIAVNLEKNLDETFIQCPHTQPILLTRKHCVTTTSFHNGSPIPEANTRKTME